MWEQLLKSMGFDPAKIKSQVDEAGKNFEKVVTHFNMRFDRIEKALADLKNEKNTPFIEPPAIPQKEKYHG